MFHFHGLQPVSKDCSHVAMSTNSISSDIQYTKEKSSVNLHPLQFAQNAPEGPVLDHILEHFPLAGGRSHIFPPTKSCDIGAPKNKDTSLAVHHVDASFQFTHQVLI